MKNLRFTLWSLLPFAHFEVRNEGKNFSKLRVTIKEGKNRELRRFFAHFEAKVLDLKRIAFGGIELNNLPENKTRYFTRREYDDVHKFMKRWRTNKIADVKNEINAKRQDETNKRNKEKEKDEPTKNKKFKYKD